MKKIIFLLVFLTGSSAFAQFKINTKTIGAGVKAVKAATLSDAEVISYAAQYIKWIDEHNPVAPKNHPLAIRLENIRKKFKNSTAFNWNKVKVLLVKDVNAFACADSSVRVLAGLMQIMTDDEVVAVMTHEMGHVANHDSKDAFRTALLTSALKEGVSSQGGVTAALSDSQLGDLGEAVANSSFSRKQESKADEYGYELLKANNINPYYMANAFGVLLKLQKESGGSSGPKLLSTHPDMEKRVKTAAEKAEKDGFKKP